MHDYIDRLVFSIRASSHESGRYHLHVYAGNTDATYVVVSGTYETCYNARRALLLAQTGEEG